MAFAVQIAMLALAVFCPLANGQSTPCAPNGQQESCGCVTASSPKPPLRIEIHERDSPRSPSVPSYPTNPSYPSYPSYPSNPSYPSYPSYPSPPIYPSYPDVSSYPRYALRPEYPVQEMPQSYMPTMNRPRPIVKYITLPSGYEPRPTDAEKDKGYYMVPVGARKKVIKVPKA